MGCNKYKNLWSAYCKISDMVSAFDFLEEFGDNTYYENELINDAVDKICDVISQNIKDILQESDSVKTIMEQL